MLTEFDAMLDQWKFTKYPRNCLVLCFQTGTFKDTFVKEHSQVEVWVRNMLPLFIASEDTISQND